MNPTSATWAGLMLMIAGAGGALAAPLTYIPDPHHTFVRFAYQHKGYSVQESRFNRTTGSVVYDAAARSATVNLVVDTRSVDTGADIFDSTIQGADFLDTATFPTATFKSTAVRFNGAVPVSIDGELTIKGITRPVTLIVTFFRHGTEFMKKETIGANATARILRSDFKLDKYSPMVSDEVTLTIAVEASLP